MARRRKIGGFARFRVTEQTRNFFGRALLKREGLTKIGQVFFANGSRVVKPKRASLLTMKAVMESMK